MIQICAFKNKKKKEVKKNPNLVANGRFQCLVALGGEGETSFSPILIFPLTNFI
jgi:hypothetical protein